MKELTISIVTVCLNSEKSIAYTLYSVFCQTYKNIEHVLVDGGSSDETLKILKKHKRRKKIIIAKNTNIYEAINCGIKKCSGDYILILNSDDILDSKKTIENAVKIIKRDKFPVYLGDVTYFHNTKFNKTVRYYSASKFELKDFNWGIMPPHPGTFISSGLAKKYPYNSKFKIASDFDFLLTILRRKNYPYKKLNMVITKMRTGGASGKNLLIHINSGLEIYKSLKNQGFFSNHFMINFRYLIKLKQFFFIKKKSSFKINSYYEKLNRYHFKILPNIKLLNFKKNFTLSALNLAFLGSYSNNEVKIYKNLIHWPDGKFSKNISSLLKKVPGRDIIKKLKIPKEIKKIVIFGNLPEISKKFIEKKFNKSVYNYILAYGSINQIKKKIFYKIKKDELILITLPTPKQEQLAEYFISKNKVYKIICIGGSVNIASGVEKEVPKILYNFEFLWRLKYETSRRLKRLVTTLYLYFIGRYVNKKLMNLNIKVIN
jgi:exopolysaccharide biosynthesis WecB/TagA/CpsF family protein